MAFMGLLISAGTWAGGWDSPAVITTKKRSARFFQVRLPTARALQMVLFFLSRQINLLSTREERKNYVLVIFALTFLLGGEATIVTQRKGIYLHGRGTQDHVGVHLQPGLAGG